MKNTVPVPREQEIWDRINALEIELDAPDMTSYRQMLIEDEIKKLRSFLKPKKVSKRKGS